MSQKKLDLSDSDHENKGPVECLGMTFESDEARREYFLEKLREKLKDPEFRKIPGFPIGEDEDILWLSDPPYYTACPNPFVEEIVSSSSQRSEHSPLSPYCSDIAAGKADRHYSAHSYPTKVPPAAVQSLLQHYSTRGSVIMDPFCGTGMTGVAAARLNWTTNVVLQDLSPNATHIADAISLPLDPERFHSLAKGILEDVSRELGWMYSSRTTGGSQPVRYFVWSDIYSCSSCGETVPIWDIEGGKSVGGLKSKAPCPNCQALISKGDMEPVLDTYYDHVLDSPKQRIKRELVMVAAESGHRLIKRDPSTADMSLARDIEGLSFGNTVPTEPMLFREGEWGDQWRSSYHHGVSHSHHFYTARNLHILAAVWARISEVKIGLDRRALTFWFTSSLSRLTRLNRYMRQHNRHVGPLSGTLFIGPIQAEISPFYFLTEKLKDLRKVFEANAQGSRSRPYVATGSSERIDLPHGSVDYIFADPPFGENLMYSELNFLSESWLRVFTDQGPEAVISVTQAKGLVDYRQLMLTCFKECFRVLRPGGWMTVEFHNSNNRVWAAIQESLALSGFTVADVRILDKKKGTTKQLTQSGTVQQDLIISVYKSEDSLRQQLLHEGATEGTAWRFVQAHLSHLPVFLDESGEVELIVERQGFLLFDRMIAFHVQNGLPVPMDAAEFYSGLSRRFPLRDEMYFLPDQVSEYEKKRAKVAQVQQLTIFPKDEATAIQWIRQELASKPRSFKELQPILMREVKGWSKHESTIELSELLEQNFLKYDGSGPVPSPIHAYLSSNFKDLRNLEKDDPRLRAKAKDRWYVPSPERQGDLEKLRERSLLKIFEEYRTSTKKKIKRDLRTEAIRAGFKAAYDRNDYQAIIDVAQKIPENVLQEDEKLLMYYDVAMTRLGDD